MNPIDLKQRCLTNYLIRCCYWYYVMSDPIIRDYEFDIEYKRLEQMEAKSKNPMIDSPTQMIWGDSAGQYPDWVTLRSAEIGETDVRESK